MHLAPASWKFLLHAVSRISGMAHSSADQTTESESALPLGASSEALEPSSKHSSNKGRGRGRTGPPRKKRDMARSEWRYKPSPFQLDLVHCFELTAKAKREQTNENATTTSKQQNDSGLIEEMPLYRSTLLNSPRTISMLRKGDLRRRLLY